MNKITIPKKGLYEMIRFYGPHLRQNMSRMSFPLYKADNLLRVKFEQKRMDLFADHFGYAVPTQKIIKRLNKFIDNKKVLSLYSRFGLWPYLLFQDGVEIVVTDNVAPKTGVPFMNIEKISPVDAIIKYDSDVLLIIWPFKSSDYKMIYEPLTNFKGDAIILVAEIDKILEIFKIISILNINNIRWTLVNEFHIPQWVDHEFKVYFIKKLYI